MRIISDSVLAIGCKDGMVVLSCGDKSKAFHPDNFGASEAVLWALEIKSWFDTLRLDSALVCHEHRVTEVDLEDWEKSFWAGVYWADQSRCPKGDFDGKAS